MNLKQIAKQANVSVSTVSFVLNNRPGIKAETRERIKTLLSENGYVIKNTNIKTNIQDSAASDVKYQILFIRYLGNGYLIDTQSDIIIQILNGIEEQAIPLGFHLTIANADSISLESILEEASKTAFGIILLGSDFPSEMLPLCEKCSVPLLIVDSYFPFQSLNTIEIDNMLAGYSAINHLYSLGHKKIGYIHSTENVGSIPEREIAYFSAMKQRNLPINSEHIIHISEPIAHIYTSMRKALKNLSSLPTAFWCDNDILATSTIRALQTLGYRVPEDVSVLGTDDSYIGLLSTPTLSSIHIPFSILGQLAAKRICEMIENPNCTIPQKTKVCVSVVERDSTAPPKVNLDNHI